MKEDWQPMCGKDNKVFEAEPWRSLDFGLKNQSQQNTEIYKVGSQLNTEINYYEGSRVNIGIYKVRSQQNMEMYNLVSQPKTEKGSSKHENVQGSIKI